LLPLFASTAAITSMESLVRLSVPIHGNKPLKIGLLKHLLKTAGLQESDLD
jgi:hypothetical protein